MRSPIRPALSGLILAALAGCLPSLEGTQCTSDDACGAGLTCNQGICGTPTGLPDAAADQGARPDRAGLPDRAVPPEAGPRDDLGGGGAGGGAPDASDLDAQGRDATPDGAVVDAAPDVSVVDAASDGAAVDAAPDVAVADATPDVAVADADADGAVVDAAPDLAVPDAGADAGGTDVTCLGPDGLPVDAGAACDLGFACAVPARWRCPPAGAAAICEPVAARPGEPCARPTESCTSHGEWTCLNGLLLCSAPLAGAPCDATRAHLDRTCELPGVVVCPAPNAAVICRVVEQPEPNCDGLDDDCDGRVDEDFDQDGDGFPGCGRCLPSDLNCQDDCDDERADVHPGAPPQCEAVDFDCDGVVAEGSLPIPGGLCACFDEAADGTAEPECALTCDSGFFDLDGGADCERGCSVVSPGHGVQTFFADLPRDVLPEARLAAGTARRGGGALGSFAPHGVAPLRLDEAAPEATGLRVDVGAPAPSTTTLRLPNDALLAALDLPAAPPDPDRDRTLRVRYATPSIRQHDGTWYVAALVVVSTEDAKQQRLVAVWQLDAAGSHAAWTGIAPAGGTLQAPELAPIPTPNGGTEPGVVVFEVPASADQALPTLRVLRLGAPGTPGALVQETELQDHRLTASALSVGREGTETLLAARGQSGAELQLFRLGWAPGGGGLTLAVERLAVPDVAIDPPEAPRRWRLQHRTTLLPAALAGNVERPPMLLHPLVGNGRLAPSLALILPSPLADPPNTLRDLAVLAELPDLGRRRHIGWRSGETAAALLSPLAVGLIGGAAGEDVEGCALTLIGAPPPLLGGQPLQAVAPTFAPGCELAVDAWTHGESGRAWAAWLATDAAGGPVPGLQVAELTCR